jgi:hypothetical protein
VVAAQVRLREGAHGDGLLRAERQFEEPLQAGGGVSRVTEVRGEDVLQEVAVGELVEGGVGAAGEREQPGNGQLTRAEELAVAEQVQGGGAVLRIEDEPLHALHIEPGE